MDERKKIGKANEKRKMGKVNRAKDGDANEQGREKERKGAPAPRVANMVGSHYPQLR